MAPSTAASELRSVCRNVDAGPDGSFDVEHGDVLGAELGDQLEQGRAQAGVRAGDDDALALVAERVGHGARHFLPIGAREHAFEGVAVHDEVVDVVGEGRLAEAGGPAADACGDHAVAGGVPERVPLEVTRRVAGEALVLGEHVVAVHEVRHARSGAVAGHGVLEHAVQVDAVAEVELGRRDRRHLPVEHRDRAEVAVQHVAHRESPQLNTAPPSSVGQCSCNHARHASRSGDRRPSATIQV